MSGTLAVLITYYNEGPLLAECISSLISGTQAPDEILVYDDCSSIPPETFIPVNANVRVLKGIENQGPAFGRNELMKASICEYVHFHDADDLFHPNWCETIRATIEANSPDVIITEIRSFDELGERTERVLGLQNMDSDLVKFAIKGVLLVPSTTFKRSIGTRIGGYRTRDILPQSEDFDFHVRLVSKIKSHICISDPLIYQRIREKSHSKNKVVCWTSALNSITLLKETLPVDYYASLSSRAAQLAATLYDESQFAEARWGFALALAIGKPDYAYKNRVYRLIAHTLGPMLAERVSSLYRHLVPQTLRAYLKSN